MGGFGIDRYIKQAPIGREQNKSRTATEDDPSFVWVSFLAEVTRKSATASTSNSVLTKNTSMS